MERGLRQGDPLALFLFLVVAECLHLMIQKAENLGLLKGVKVGKSDVLISDLQYANDVILFGPWEIENLKNMKKVMEYVFEVSGLKMNLNKSKLYGIGVKDEEVGSSMRAISSWVPVIEKTKNKLTGWKAKLFSFGGRWTLTWGGSSVWSNIAKVGSEVDKLGINFSTSFRKVIRDWVASKFWEDSWMETGRLKDKFARLFKLETSKNISVAERGEFEGEKWRWRWGRRREPRGRELGELENLEKVLKDVLPKRDVRDRIIWSLDPTGGFSVKELRRIVEEAVHRNSGARCIETMWLKEVPKKICIFMWREGLGRFLVRLELDKRGVDLDLILCPRCEYEGESVDHAIFGCREVKSLWRQIGERWKVDVNRCNSFLELSNLGNEAGMGVKEGRRWIALTWCVAYLIWANRNKFLFGNVKTQLKDEFFSFQVKSFDWVNMRDKKIAMDWRSWMLDPRGSSG
ncbi:hypothetical protein OSB04_001844 [Centaurea solstitialis]|uniref:Reverse transcriptase domain-containing protein n=1 Tax=Centaurea solstitialis TaxID=347529 RepID=A0AA38TZB5_9ASTR|nr:hypothetical protein OSB04_001844 [Centaurea solstitialis]